MAGVTLKCLNKAWHLQCRGYRPTQLLNAVIRRHLALLRSIPITVQASCLSRHYFDYKDEQVIYLTGYELVVHVLSWFSSVNISHPWSKVISPLRGIQSGKYI
ncbi:hypothetical protein BDV10DRAFT_91353 [Aspergillus recurvatus]